MIEEIVKLGLPTAVGVLMGVALIVWIEPAGIGGIIIILVVSICIAYIGVAVVTKLMRSE